MVHVSCRAVGKVCARACAPPIGLILATTGMVLVVGGEGGWMEGDGMSAVVLSEKCGVCAYAPPIGYVLDYCCRLSGTLTPVLVVQGGQKYACLVVEASFVRPIECVGAACLE